MPSVLAVPDVRDSMEAGRSAATRALTAARNGDAPAAELNFRRAAGEFEEAADQLSSPLLAGGRAIPVLGANVNAARTLADIGKDLAAAGEQLTGEVNPEALQVVDGRLPIEEVRRVEPVLADGFSLFVGHADGSSQATVLAVRPPVDGLEAWDWDLPVGGGTYHALFPRAWQTFDASVVGVDVTGEQLSPVIAGDKLYAVSREQGVFVLATGPEFKQLAHNRFSADTSVFNATPAVSEGQLFLRSDRFLYCLGGRTSK